jgi:hypothetical protein
LTTPEREVSGVKITVAITSACSESGFADRHGVSSAARICNGCPEKANVHSSAKRPDAAKTTGTS